jgi:hypothetical protein
MWIPGVKSVDNATHCGPQCRFIRGPEIPMCGDTEYKWHAPFSSFGRLDWGIVHRCFLAVLKQSVNPCHPWSLTREISRKMHQISKFKIRSSYRGRRPTSDISKQSKNPNAEII